MTTYEISSFGTNDTVVLTDVSEERAWAAAMLHCLKTMTNAGAIPVSLTKTNNVGVMTSIRFFYIPHPCDTMWTVDMLSEDMGDGVWDIVKRLDSEFGRENWYQGLHYLAQMLLFTPKEDW